MRADLIQELIDDVLNKSEKYEFSVDSYDQALECIGESADRFGEELTQQETLEAANRLVEFFQKSTL